MVLNDINIFLKDLASNNNKAWMHKNKDRYNRCKLLFIDVVAQVIKDLSKHDKLISGIEPKECIFRINRDIRFSKDKTPYKKNFGAFISSLGKKKEGGAGYYLHLQPANMSFLGGGIYKIDSKTLLNVRTDIAKTPSNILNILDKPIFKKIFGAVQGDKLVNPPRGFDKNNPNIELIKHKDFFVLHHLADSVAFDDKKLVRDTCDAFKLLTPFNTYLNNMKMS